STPRDLVVVVTDTAPVALPDTNTVAEGVGSATTTTSGNVMVPPGASTGDVQDLLGADATSVVGLDSGTSTGDLSGNIGTSFAGNYGSIVLNADGTYTYTLDNRNPAVQRLNNGQTLTEVFRYTIMDSDGDVSTTTLTITIRGVSDTPAEPSLPPTQPPAAPPQAPAPTPERLISGNGQLELPRNEIRYPRLDIDQIADRLRPRLYVLPAVQEVRELVQGKGVDIDHISDIMDPSLYVLPAVEASSRQASDAAQPAIDRFNDSDTDDNGVVIEWKDDAETAPANADKATNADKAQAPEAERPAAVPAQKLSVPVQSMSAPEVNTSAATPPVARVEFTEQVRKWAGTHSILQRAAELDLLFDEPASAEAAPSPQVADTPQA
ncbi:MAG TPA: VCBS domain-containing protein, partial [Hydrogenophaga sp.]|nr:VCBS domain-containing protein [Hydrogenophaga sp.]